MFKIKKVMASVVAAAITAVAVNGIIANAYTYASNEVQFDLYTHAPSVAPDIYTVSERVYISNTRTAVNGVCSGYTDTGNTETVIKLAIPSKLASSTCFTTFEDVGQLRSVSLVSGWVSQNGGSCYITCTASLLDYDLNKEFTCRLFVY